jgi:hypothetical protein
MQITTGTMIKGLHLLEWIQINVGRRELVIRRP